MKNGSKVSNVAVFLCFGLILGCREPPESVMVDKSPDFPIRFQPSVIKVERRAPTDTEILQKYGIKTEGIPILEPGELETRNEIEAVKTDLRASLLVSDLTSGFTDQEISELAGCLVLFRGEIFDYIMLNMDTESHKEGEYIFEFRPDLQAADQLRLQLNKIFVHDLGLSNSSNLMRVICREIPGVRVLARTDPIQITLFVDEVGQTGFVRHLPLNGLNLTIAKNFYIPADPSEAKFVIARTISRL